MSRSTDAVATRIPLEDAELIRRTATTRGMSVSSLLHELLADPLARLRRGV